MNIGRIAATFTAAGLLLGSASAAVAAQLPWQYPANPPPLSPTTMILLTDGSVLMQDGGNKIKGGSVWWKYTPDINGSYISGNWTKIAPMPSGYNPLYYASGVLPSGKVIVEGGEYNANTGKYVWMGRGALYDPLSDSWTEVAPPKGMSASKNSIGDAESVILADGSFMLSPVYYPASGPQQIFDPVKLTWTATGQNKLSGNDEAGQVLLPNNLVLTVDMNNSGGPRHSELFDPSTGAWSSAGDTKVEMVKDGEIGPMVLMPNGKVFSVGATGATAIYDYGANLWSAGPRLPIIFGKQFVVEDGPCAVLPSGRVLLMASGYKATSGAHYFTFDGSRITRATDSPDAGVLLPYYTRMMALPTGQIMVLAGSNLQFYTESADPTSSPPAPNPAWAPTILAVPSRLAVGTTYKLLGSQLGGLSQGAAYGDDYQPATNYPLIRVVNNKSGHVFYARTFDRTSSSLAPGAKSATSFTLPKAVESGASKLFVVTNGIPSKPVAVTILGAGPGA